MNIKSLNKFREFLIKSKISVSELEFTKGNYDHSGNFIKEYLPTITTDFCEIGLYDNKIYFVFIIKSKTFNLELFSKIKYYSNIKIYGFVNFKSTLFPSENFDLDNFIKKIQDDKYLQIQFDFNDIVISDLFKEYTSIVNVFKKNKTIVVNQLEYEHLIQQKIPKHKTIKNPHA